MRPVLQFAPSAALQQAALIVALALSLVVAARLSSGRIAAIRRRRLLFGLPCGTLLVSGFVLAIYAVVQGGLLPHPPWFRTPMVVPFRAYSYLYPLGVLTSGFAHSGFGHLLGNLVGTLAFGTVAEVGWSHYPTRRGTATFSSLRTTPYARVAAFVAGTLAVGVLTGVFSLGPAIGFSGVVFALAGFAVTRYPIATVIASVADGVLSLLFYALRDPSSVARAREGFLTPWWADVALQGHALGLFIGAVAGAYVVRRRSSSPDGARLWLGLVLFAIAQGMWAVNVPLGSGRWQLFRAVGTATVFLVAAVLTGAVLASARPAVARIDLQFREVAGGLAVAGLVALAAVAVPYGFFTVADPGPGISPENSVEVRDYTVAYAEDVPDRYISSVNSGPFGEATRVNASGVIVVSERRQIWWEEVSTGRVAADGGALVRVGGVAWRETVLANRSGYAVAGNRSAYVVRLRRGDERRLAFASDPSRAEPLIAGRTVTVVPGERFSLRVTHNGSLLGSTRIPAGTRSTTAGGLRFVREDRTVYAVHPATARPLDRSDRSGPANVTRVRVATRETE